jgi:hypothetical protein
MSYHWAAEDASAKYVHLFSTSISPTLFQRNLSKIMLNALLLRWRAGGIFPPVFSFILERM